MMTETKIVFYGSTGGMQRGIKKMEKKGWEAISTEAVDRGWNGAKACCLGVLFLPLALLGKKSKVYKVQYRRQK